MYSVVYSSPFNTENSKRYTGSWSDTLVGEIFKQNAKEWKVGSNLGEYSWNCSSSASTTSETVTSVDCASQDHILLPLFFFSCTVT